jgi:hypothetical protein
VTIIILYVILVISTCALVCVGIAMYLRVRRLSRASETQFFRALKDVPEHPAHQPDDRKRAAASASEIAH